MKCRRATELRVPISSTLSPIASLVVWLGADGFLFVVPLIVITHKSEPLSVTTLPSINKLVPSVADRVLGSKQQVLYKRL